MTLTMTLLMRTRTFALAALMLAVGWTTAFAEGAPTRPEDQFFDSNGVKIRFVEQGEGEPLLLLHGFSVNVEFQWGANIGELAETFRVIAFDARGHGKSEKPHGVEHYGSEMLEDAIRLLDHLGIEKSYVMGYSMGGAMTMGLVALHPDRIKAAIVGGQGWPQANEEMNEFIEVIASGLESGQGIKPLILALTPTGEAPMSEQQMDQLNAMFMASNDTDALASVVRSFAHLPEISAEMLASNEVPTLIIIGTADPLERMVPPAEAVMTNLTVVRLEGDNHMTAPRNPDFYRAARAFFNGEDPDAALTPIAETATAGSSSE